MNVKNKFNNDEDLDYHFDPIPVYDALRTRRSVRTYQDKLIPHDNIEEMLRMSTHAPSACNRRGWRFILIEDKNRLLWLYKKGSAAFINNINQAILVCYYRHTDNLEWNDVDQSAAAAIAYFQLIAHINGIGSCWICHLPPRKEVKKYFKIPKQYNPIALISIGYYKKNMTTKSRDVFNEEILSLNEWDFLPTAEKEFAGLKMLLRRFARWLYYIFPKRELLRNIVKDYEKKFDD